MSRVIADRTLPKRFIREHSDILNSWAARLGADGPPYVNIVPRVPLPPFDASAGERVCPEVVSYAQIVATPRDGGGWTIGADPQSAKVLADWAAKMEQQK